MALILLFLGILGICKILRFSELITPIRQKIEIIDTICSCSMCSGFWAGMIGLILNIINPYLLIPFAGSFICSIIIKEEDNG